MPLSKLGIKHENIMGKGLALNDDRNPTEREGQ